MKRLPAAVTQRHWLRRMDETEPQDRPDKRLAVPEKRR